MTRSILKRKPDVIICPDGNGGRVEFSGSDWLMGRCLTCGNMFLVTSNLGAMVCPHGCGLDNIEWVWCKPKMVWIQQHNPMKIDKTGKMK